MVRICLSLIVWCCQCYCWHNLFINHYCNDFDDKIINHIYSYANLSAKLSSDITGLMWHWTYSFKLRSLEQDCNHIFILKCGHKNSINISTTKTVKKIFQSFEKVLELLSTIWKLIKENYNNDTWISNFLDD